MHRFVKRTVAEPGVFIHLAVTVAVVGDVPAVRFTVAIPLTSVIAHCDDSLPASVVKVRFAPATGVESMVTVAVILDVVEELTTSTMGEAVT